MKKPPKVQIMLLLLKILFANNCSQMQGYSYLRALINLFTLMRLLCCVLSETVAVQEGFMAIYEEFLSAHDQNHVHGSKPQAASLCKRVLLIFTFKVRLYRQFQLFSSFSFALFLIKGRTELSKKLFDFSITLQN